MMDPQVRLRLEQEAIRFGSIAERERRNAVTHHADAQRSGQLAKEATRTADIAAGTKAELEKLLSA